MDYQTLAERMTIGCRILAEQDIIDAFGHLSARVPDSDNLFVISRGMSPALVEPQDFIVLDLDGKVVEGNGFPNAEWPIHASIYRARPDVGSVLHSHSELSRIFSLSPIRLRGTLLTAVTDWNNGLPVYRKPGLINTPERGDALAGVLGTGSAALLRGHGDVVADGDVTRTVLRSIMLKQNASALNAVLAHGQPDYWEGEDAEGWAEQMHQHLSPEARAGLANRVWDYYEARVNGRLAHLLQAGV